MCVVSSVGNICIAPGPAATTPSTVPSVTSATTTPCVDQARPGQVSDCPRLAYLCNNPLYYYLMTEQCPLTCNRCGGTSGTVARKITLILLNC
ncbi:unnamed protein product [Toxocara canis]|uniref:ShKT domain-containing protein n=1 Tax=Toxocara canis TaxID=6265 RepID=A0A183U7Q9_TOXCA|nr:unnamed protein product [Toxocara canis]